MSEQMDRVVKRPPWRSRRLTLSAGALAVAAAVVIMLVAFVAPARRSVRVAIGTVTIDQVQRGVFHDFTSLQGKVAPRDVVYIDALEGGQVQQLFAEAGDRVALGQPLVRFRNTDVELDVLNRQAIVAQSLAQAQTLENGLEATRAGNEKALQQIDYDIVRLRRAATRREPFVSKGVFPQEQIDQLHDELDYDLKLRPVQAETNERQEALRRAQLPQIQSELATLEKSLSAIRARLDDLTVKAPVSGRITVMDLKIGQTEKPGDRLAELVPDTGFKIAADVDEYYLGRVMPGQVADIDLGSRTVQLTVERIYPQVQNGVFTVDLKFDGPAPPGLISGQAVQGKLSLGADRPALILPAGAFLERSGGDYVFVLTPDGRHADRRRIKIGRRNSDQVEVLGGLRQGDRVITSDYQGFEKLDRIDLTG